MSLSFSFLVEEVEEYSGATGAVAGGERTAAASEEGIEAEKEVEEEAAERGRGERSSTDDVAEGEEEEGE